MNERTADTRTRAWAAVLLALAVFALVTVGTLVTTQPAEADPVTSRYSTTATGDRTFTRTAPTRGYLYFEIKVLSEGSVDYELWSKTRSAQYSWDTVYYGDGPKKTIKVCAKGGESIELRVSDDSDDNPRYTVTAVFTFDGGFEEEGNDGFSSANEIRLDSEKRGIADEFSDDYFKYKATKTGYYTLNARMLDEGGVTFEAYRGDESIDWGIACYGDSWQETKAIPVRAGQTLYAKMSNYSEDDPLYEVKLTYAPISKPSGTAISSVKKAGKKKLAVKWARGGDIDGYQVRWSKWPSMIGSKTRTIEASSWDDATLKTTIGKLSSKKRYYVQVRTYKYNEDFDETLYSSWSGAKSAVVK